MRQVRPTMQGKSPAEQLSEVALMDNGNAIRRVSAALGIISFAATPVAQQTASNVQVFSVGFAA